MKIGTALVSLLLSTAVAARWFDAADGDGDEDKAKRVPGKNPLVYCDEPDEYILSIDHVDLKPNPPQAGKNLTIKATGTLNQDVKRGAKIRVTVKYGVIQILNQEIDLCDQVKNVDLKCPLEKGDVELEKVVELPKEIPPGKYNVRADAFTKDTKDTITCLAAAIRFGVGSARADEM